MKIEDVRKIGDIGDVMTLSEFMDCVHGHGFIPDDGSGVFVFKEDTEIHDFRKDRSVWSVLEEIRKPCEKEEGEIIGWDTVKGKVVPKRADYYVEDYLLPAGLEDKIECVVWYNR